jgi:ABC-2 type transport system ATP-binding protein
MIEIDARALPQQRAPYDLIRDTACELGLGLVRIQAEHGRIQDVFEESGVTAHG